MLSSDKKKMLTACLDQIKDDHNLVAGAKCLVQTRHTAHSSFSSQNFERGQAANKSPNIASFITSDGSKEKDCLENQGYGKNPHRMSKRAKTDQSISQNELSKRPRHAATAKFFEILNINILNKWRTPPCISSKFSNILLMNLSYQLIRTTRFSLDIKKNPREENDKS